MTFLSNQLISDAVQAATDLYVVTECTFHGITVNYENFAPIFLVGKVKFEDGRDPSYPNSFSFSQCTFSQCICIDSPNIDSAGAIKTVHGNFSMKDSIIIGCVGYYSSISAYQCLSSEIQNSVTTECSGFKFAQLHLYKPGSTTPNPNLKSLQKFHNITNNELGDLSFDYGYVYSAYCCFLDIKCNTAFEYHNQFSKSNLIRCNMTFLNGIFDDCYFENCYSIDFSGNLQNCSLFESSIGNYSSNINEEASIPMDIKKFDEFQIKLNSTVIKGDQKNSPAKISFIYDDILITDCVFTNISTDTVILMQNSLIKKVIVEHSYFSNISTSSSSGIIYMSKHRSSLSITFPQNYVHNSLNSLCLFLSIGPRVDKVYDTEPHLHVNCSSLSFDADYSSESLMRYSQTMYEILNTNMTTNKVKLTMCFSFSAGNSKYYNAVLPKQTLHYNKFYNSSSMYFLNGYIYHKYEECTFINFHCVRRLVGGITNDEKIPFFYSCAFINSSVPEESELSGNTCLESSCIPHYKNIETHWATPSVKEPKGDTYAAIVASVTVSCIVAVFIVLIVIVVIQKKRIKKFEERKALEKNVLDDFG